MYSSTAYIPQSCQGKFGRHGKESGGAGAVQRQCKGPCRGSAAGVNLVARQTTRHSQVEGTAYYTSIRERKSFGIRIKRNIWRR